MRRMLSVAVAVAIASLIVIPVAAGWTWPAEGPVLRPFSLAADQYAAGQHRGIDIGTAVDAPVRAPAAGTVSFAGPVPGGGRAVTILTAEGYAVTLLQLGSTVVAPGGTVAEGAVVGHVGESEDATTRVSHVHLGIRVAAEPNGYVDPTSLLPARRQVTAPEPVAVAAPEPAALPAVVEPVPPALADPVADPVTATVPTEVTAVDQEASNSVAGRPHAAESARRSQTPRIAVAPDRAPEARAGAARPAPARSRAAATRPVVVRPTAPRAAVSEPPSAHVSTRPRLATAAATSPAPIAVRPPRPFDGVVVTADPHDAIRPVGPSREGAADGGRRLEPAVAPARRGGRRGRARRRGCTEGCTYH